MQGFDSLYPQVGNMSGIKLAISFTPDTPDNHACKYLVFLIS